MPNDIRRLREQNLFGQYGIPSLEDNFGSNPQLDDIFAGIDFGSGVKKPKAPSIMQPPPVAATQPKSVQQDLIDMTNQMYTPETKSRDRFNSLLDAPPQVNKPGWARKLVASGMAIGSKDPVKSAEEVMQAPYLRKMADWKAKSEPFSQAAQQENTANVNERNLAGNLATNTVNLRKLEETERSNRAKEENTRIRTQAYNYSVRLGKGWDWDLSGPTAKKINKSTGEVVDTGLETGKMDEQTKIELQNEGRVAAAEASGMAAVNRAFATGAGMFQDPATGKRYKADANGNLEEVTGGPAGPINRVGTPSRTGGSAANTLEKTRIRNEKLGQAYQTDPIGKQYVRKITEGKYDFQPRPVLGAKTGTTFGFGGSVVTQDDVDKYDQFRREIDPEYTPPRAITTPAVKPTSTQGIGPQNVPARGAGPNAPQGGTPIRVRNKVTGQTGTIDASKADAAIKSGRFERVQ